jgi:hypothetical protein
VFGFGCQKRTSPYIRCSSRMIYGKPQDNWFVSGARTVAGILQCSLVTSTHSLVKFVALATLHGSKITCQYDFLLSAVFNRIYFEITTGTVWNSKWCRPGHAEDPTRSLIRVNVSHVGCVVNWTIDGIIQVYFLEVHHLSLHYQTAGNAAIAAVPCYHKSGSTHFF